MTFKSFLEKYFTVFIYISLFFVVVFLVRYDYFTLDFRSIRYKPLMVSFLFLFLGCLANAATWTMMCRFVTDKISPTGGITSHGLSIFGKYIPGKIWTVLGRATYISRTGVPIKRAVHLSLYTQMLSVWSGLTVGMVTLFHVQIDHFYIILAILLWAVLSLALLIPFFMPSIDERLSFISFHGGNPQHGRLTLKSLGKVLPAFFICWFLWTAAFYFLQNSVILHFDTTWLSAFTFPFAATIGILAILFPGGLGVREGLLVFFLMNYGMSFELSTLVSVSSRIWFTIGEVFIFIVALVIKFIKNQKIKRTQKVTGDTQIVP